MIGVIPEVAMSRFAVHVSWQTAKARADAFGKLARRYPEVEVIEVARLDDGVERWTCRAPSITHLRRWAREQRVDAEIVAISPGQDR